MKRKCVFFFLSFLWVEKSFTPAWIRKETVNSVAMWCTLTWIESLIFWNSKGCRNFPHLPITCRRTEDVWRASYICTSQQEWRKTIPSFTMLLFRAIGKPLDLIKTSRKMWGPWKWILQTSPKFISFWLGDGVCAGHQPARLRTLQTCLAALARQKEKSSCYLKVDFGLKHEEYKKWRIAMYGRASRVSMPWGSEHLCTDWEGASACEST